MSGYDEGAVTNQRIFNERVENSNEEVENEFVDFIQGFHIESIFIYRDQLRQNFVLGQHFLEVEMEHLIQFKPVLANKIISSPTEYLAIFEDAVKIAAKLAQLIDPSDLTDPSFQVLLKSGGNSIPIRNLDSSLISKLVKVPGIIISASMTVAKATEVHLMCRNCQGTITVKVKNGLNGVQLPRVCQIPRGEANAGQERCPMDPFVIIPDKSECVDQQTLKIQEAPDMVPVGELPRFILATVDRCLTGKAVPGTRVTLIGIFSIFSSRVQGKNNRGGIALRQSYLRVVGMEFDNQGSGRAGKLTFTQEEEREILELSKQPDIYERFASSIAPSIFGFKDVKKAVACLLFGGSRKILKDGMKLRGDINVLLLGDPGTAKSQTLKFVEKVAPIGVYTSGKGSSAAGLTASVVRDAATRDFYLEGGAMVLADGGVVCIDEFDKMREEDRVSIHEAMEQQTISIAKAGITTMLNSRTSVLAAANPLFGSYDDFKTPAQNIDFQSTILSRFDMIFIVKDHHNEEQDLKLARHVLNVHMTGTLADPEVGDIPIQLMKKYISYCKSKCAPRLSNEAAEKLSNHFVTIRAEVRGKEEELNERSSIPITIRQLEAIIRISESLAKMSLTPTVLDRHVDEAIRLFKVSTLDAVHSGQMMEGMTRPEMIEEIEGIENKIKKRLPRGSRISSTKLVDSFLEQGHNRYAIEKCINVMLRRDELKHANGRMYLVRVR